MDRTYTTQKLAVLALTFLFTVISVAAAQDPEHPALQPPSGMSGTVVDAEGNPIAGFTFAIQPMRFHEGHLQPEGGFLEFQIPPEGMEGQGMPRTTSRVKNRSRWHLHCHQHPTGTYPIKGCFECYVRCF